MKVNVKYKRGGKVKAMHPRYANILERAGLVERVDSTALVPTGRKKQKPTGRKFKETPNVPEQADPEVHLEADAPPQQEEPAAAPDQTAEQVEISKRTGKPKRTYKRRDLTAEE